MAVFFLLLAFIVGIVVGDALIENESTGTITLFGQSTDQFTDGQLLLAFAGLGILFAVLLGLSLSSTRRRRARRRERRTAGRELEDRATELERDNARLRTDLTQREEALAGREAELAHRDRQLALKDEELARYGAVAGSAQATAATEAARREQDADRVPEPTTAPEATAVMDRVPPGSAERSRPEATEVADGASPEQPVVADRTPPAASTASEPTVVAARPARSEATKVEAGPAESGRASATGGEQPVAPLLSPEDTEPVAPLHDEPPWQSARADDRSRSATDSAAGGRVGQTEADAPAERVPPGTPPPEPGPADGRARPDGAAHQGAGGTAEEERTRQIQRPDRNA
jgi:hypothetical protein